MTQYTLLVTPIYNVEGFSFHQPELHCCFSVPFHSSLHWETQHRKKPTQLRFLHETSEYTDKGITTIWKATLELLTNLHYLVTADAHLLLLNKITFNRKWCHDCTKPGNLLRSALLLIIVTLKLLDFHLY